MIEQLINDENKNLLLCEQHINVFKEYSKKRRERKRDNFFSYIDQYYPNGFVNTNTLEELTAQLNELVRHRGNITKNLDKWDELINNMQSRIDNNQYTIEDSIEYSERLAYQAKVSAFVWPNQEEIDIRAQEEQELLAYLEQNT